MVKIENHPFLAYFKEIFIFIVEDYAEEKLFHVQL